MVPTNARIVALFAGALASASIPIGKAVAVLLKASAVTRQSKVSLERHPMHGLVCVCVHDLPTLLAGTSFTRLLLKTRIKSIRSAKQNFVNGSSTASAGLRVLCGVVAVFALADELVTEGTGLEAVAVQL